MECRQLVAEGLACAGRHHRDRVAAVDNGTNDLFLAGPEFFQTKRSAHELFEGFDGSTRHARGHRKLHADGETALPEHRKVLAARLKDSSGSSEKKSADAISDQAPDRHEHGGENGPAHD